MNSTTGHPKANKGGQDSAFITALSKAKPKNRNEQADRNENEDAGAKSKPSCAPRVSFGVELEFLVAISKSTTNLDIIDSLPPLYTGEDVHSDIAKLLCQYGIDAEAIIDMKPDGDRLLRQPCTWIITDDTSVDGARDDCNDCEFVGVEIISPASYAYEEAFEILEVVARLITTHFRARVNESCGYHVHVGNGPYRIGFQAARNFAALTWASEPKFSALHCPSRVISEWTRSSRSTKSSRLAQGMGASEAYWDAIEDSQWPARYQGRARKVGEKAIPSNCKLLERFHLEERDSNDELLEPDCDSDSSDFRAESEPFWRPRKHKGKRFQTEFNAWENVQFEGDYNPEALRRLDNDKSNNGPPQLGFPIPDSIRKLSRENKCDDHDIPKRDQVPSTRKASSLSRLGRPLEPILDRTMLRSKPASLEKIIFDTRITDRYKPNNWRRVRNSSDKHEYLEKIKPLREGSWSGVKELLSCDIGTHQVSYLMSCHQRSVGRNWNGLSKAKMSLLPGMSYNRSSPHMTVESREAGGTLDAWWISTWARIQCRLMEFARDAEPSVLMRVIGLLAEDEAHDDDDDDDATYDVVDLLQDIGCYVEARYCEERLRRMEEAWFECMLLKGNGKEA